jgi:3-hydroxybutyryl-CoA dehydrogenase
VSEIVTEVGKVGIVGCGTMGSGIAEIVARNGLPVAFVEQSDEAVDERGRADRRLARAAGQPRPARGRERDEILGRITGSTDWADLGDCDLIVEAVPRSSRSSRQAFREIDAVPARTPSSRPTPRRCR